MEICFFLGGGGDFCLNRMTNHVNSCLLDEKTKSESGDGSTWLGMYSRYPLCRAASLLWPHFPINPQAPMRIMTKTSHYAPQAVMGFHCEGVT